MIGATAAKTSNPGPRNCAIPAVERRTDSGTKLDASKVAPENRISRRNTPAKATATNTASVSKRAVSSSAPPGPVSVRMPTSSENNPNATSAASAACLNAPAKSRCRVLLPSCVTRIPVALDLLNFGTAENSGGQDDQHDHQDRERGNVLIFDGKI